jgi:hypothetical protein
MFKICPECESKWLDGQLYWATGKTGCPHDLAGLLCNDINSERCINPCKGSTSGVTWAQRRQFLDSLNEKD